MRALGLALAIGLVASPTIAADINAPVDTHPTIASEIRRGWFAGEKCQSSSFVRQPDDMLNIAGIHFIECFDKLIVSEKAYITNADSFAIGVRLKAIIATSAENSSFQKDPNLYMFGIRDFLRDYNDLIKREDITSAQAISALPNPAPTYMVGIIDMYEKQLARGELDNP